MGDGRVRQDAVAKVENKRVSPERFEDGVDPTIERRSAGEQYQRIEIALNGPQRLNLVARKTATPSSSRAPPRRLAQLQGSAATQFPRRAESR